MGNIFFAIDTHTLNLFNELLALFRVICNVAYILGSLAYRLEQGSGCGRRGRLSVLHLMIVRFCVSKIFEVCH